MNIKVQALLSLIDNPKFHWRAPYATSDLEWTDERVQPTQAEINTEVTRLQAEYDNAQYARDRSAAYPSLQDQADMAYWDRKNGTTTLDDAIDAVKAAHPKPE